MKQISENRETIQIPLDKRWESFPQTCFCAVQYIFLLCTMSAILLWCTNQNKRRPLQTTSFERRTPLFLLGVLYVTCTGLVKKKRWTKSIIVVSLSPSFYSLVRFLLLSRSLSSCIPFSPPPTTPKPRTSSPGLIRSSTCSPLCSATLTSRLVLLLRRTAPVCFRIMEWMLEW